MISNVSTLPLPDLYPPSQITDLEATPVGDEINLTWTAPGDNFDVGKGKHEVTCGVESKKCLLQKQGIRVSGRRTIFN